MKVKQMVISCILFMPVITLAQIRKEHNPCFLDSKAEERRLSPAPLVSNRVDFQMDKAGKLTNPVCLPDSVFDYSKNSANQWYVSGKVFYAYNGNNQTIDERHQTLTGSTWANSFQVLRTYDIYNNLLNTLVRTWKNGAWVDSTLRNTVYANNKPVTDIFQIWGTGGWKNQYRYINLFDLNGNEISATLQNWINGSWVNARVVNYVFDGSYNQTSQFIQDWNGSAWVNSENYIFTYDTNYRRTSKLFQFWNGSAWQNSELYSYTWNSSNSLTTQLYMLWNGTAWAFNRLNVLSYVANNNTNNLEQHLVNGIWKDQFQWKYTYNSNNNQLSSTFETPDSSSSGWTIREKNTYTYCSANCRESSLYQTADSAGVLQKVDSATTLCNALPTGLKSWKKTDGRISLYPNPASAAVVLIAPDVGKSLEIRIADLLGNPVKNLISDVTETVIDLEGIGDGVYFVTVTREGISTTKKMVINK